MSWKKVVSSGILPKGDCFATLLIDGKVTTRMSYKNLFKPEHETQLVEYLSQYLPTGTILDSHQVIVVRPRKIENDNFYVKIQYKKV